ncbi:hypothetical protein A5660_09585 [Mycobacterium alsense]|uniref:DUF3060 domain-containing protein n=1 Tax=Mycobacterium alsense TaxID=324058 RepID=UPI00080005CF|nr:DUF3060 domain-containing protein [Mycobacterium alsense]OBI95731.1 hypothetical protein A5660_09585 [Mycobacterium alsense]
MKDDDPEKRIRELEQQLADVSQNPQSQPTYTEGTAYPDGPAYSSGSPYGFDFPPLRRRKSYTWLLLVVALAFLGPIIISLITHFVRPTPHETSGPRTPASAGPTAVPQGGELRVGGNMGSRTIACNDGNLTLYGYGTTYTVTGHCAALTVGGYNNIVTVDGADALESTGYGNTVTDKACNNATLKLSSYGITFNVTGHCDGLAITSYDNKVTVDSVDAITVSGYNNDVAYHSGTPKVTDSGYSNNIRQG